MRFLHLSDLHIGKIVCEHSMLAEQRYILAQVADLVRDCKADAVLIAGDVYDRAVPSEDAVTLFDEFVVRLSAAGVAVFAVAGNHDSGERLQWGARLLSRAGVYIAGTYAPNLSRVTLTDAFGAVHVHLLPYVRRATIQNVLEREALARGDEAAASATLASCATYDDAIRAAMQRAQVDTSARNVLLLHQFVAHGASRPEAAGSESVALNLGTVDAIAGDLFDDFDYVAMGHIHRPQWIGRETMRYAGSPLQYSLTESEDVKSVPVVTMGKKGAVQVECVPLHPRRRIRHVTGTLDALRAHATETDDYMYVTLTDEVPPLQAAEQVRRFYPNTMRVAFARREDAGALTPVAAVETKSFAELVTSFYESHAAQAPTEEMWAILTAAAREAGVTE